MPFKPLSHLARLSFAKGVAHAYTPGAIVAGQQGLGTLHQLPVAKLSKAAHVQNAFSTASGNPGAGAKTGHASNSGGSDSLTQYFAAFNHAQQTGDDTELKKHQVARSVGWKQAEKTSGTKPSNRLDAVKPTDILRQPVRLPISRTQSGSAAQEQSKQDNSEADALAKIDEAISQEIRTTKNDFIAEATESRDAISDEAESVELSGSDGFQSPATPATSSLSDISSIRSEEIVESGEQSKYADIPYQFQSMVKDGLVPNVHAYNYIIQSAINLAGGYQQFPRAVEVFNDMTNKGVQPNEDTYRILITFLASQSLMASQAQKEIKQHNTRYGQGDVSFTFASVTRKDGWYGEDLSILMATKFYNIARQEMKGFRLSDSQYSTFLHAYKASNAASDTVPLSRDMHSQQLLSSPTSCIAAIDACVQSKDLSGAKFIYQQYRDLAMSGNTNEILDNQAYTALIRAYYAAGAEDEGLMFFEKAIESYAATSEKAQLVQNLTDTVVVDGLVEHYVETGNFHQALETLRLNDLSKSAHARAISRVLSAAADSNNENAVQQTLSANKSDSFTDDAIMAVSAMSFRAGQVVRGQAFWAQYGRKADVSFATMYALATLTTGNVEAALSELTKMFRSIRISAADAIRSDLNTNIDESVLLLGEKLAQGNIVYSSQAAVLLFRVMIENGGLVPFITQAAVARIGPDCVHTMSEQDIALALHVQALVLPEQTLGNGDAAQVARFSHLLQTVLDRRIGMDPTTVDAVDNALPRLGGARKDLEQRWNTWRTPELAVAQLASPTFSRTTEREPASSAQLFDPYGHTTDHRASKAIAEILESPSGRIENHINEAMNRLKNVRRMGRHLQYSTYAKLITAAGKAKQSTLMHEVLNMAQTDVAFNPVYPSVRTGWVSIYDSMIAACLSVDERQLAANFHKKLLSLGAAPSANTFGIYITTLEGTFDEATEAVKIFQRAIAEGVTPTVFLFNAVIGKLGKARRIDDCLQYFGQMQNLGIRPSSVTYGTLVNALCRTSEETFAVEMFDEMEAAPNYRPRPAPYNSIIQFFLNTKRDRAKVLQYYGRMRSRDIKPTSHTYKLLIESYATLEPVNLTAAEAVLQDMKANGVMPEAVHYGSLIHAKGCVLSDVAGARATFDAVLANRSIRPTDNLYQNLLEAMVANHQVTETDAIIADMQSRGIRMTPYIANTLIHGWAGAGQITKAQQIYNSLGMANREPSTYEAMTRAFIAADDHASANAVVKEMLKKGYPTAVAEKVLGLIGSA